MAGRGRPKSKTKNKTVSKILRITCLTCGNEKSSRDFYSSSKFMHSGTGKIPYCKDCIKRMSMKDKNTIDIEKFKEVLREIDKPFLYDLLQSSFDEAQKSNSDVLGIYFKNICSLPQYKDLGYSASAFNAEIKEEIKATEIFEYNFSSEILERWKGYPLEDVEHLENFYESMQNDNRIESVQDKIYLKKLAVINLEQDKAGKRGDWGMFDKLGTMFSKFMQDSKLRAQDRSEADRTGGIRNFCQIYSEVEKDDFIPPWNNYNKIHGLTQDVLDETIMHIENFTLRLNKQERMVRPPIDTPKAKQEEIDLNNPIKYTFGIKSCEDEDVINNVD